jgi:5'-nucleotidase
MIHRMPTHKRLVVITNDDGIGSPGLHAAVRAALALGEPVVVAPARQWSASGRGLWVDHKGQIRPYPLKVDGQAITAYEVGASPAMVVLHGLLELVPRRPDLLISGINYGENLGTDITRSGTIGAALQAASAGIPCLASSLQTPKELHARHDDHVDFSAAAHFTRLFAEAVLRGVFSSDVDILKVDIPDDATPTTPWRLTRVSRHCYYETLDPGRWRLAEGMLSEKDIAVGLDYTVLAKPERTEPDSDIYALRVDRVVSVTPLSLDLTSRVDPAEFMALLLAAVSP